MNALPRVAGIVLAAGGSSRMGRTKQSLPFHGKTILEWVVDNALASSLLQVIVVLGHEADLLQSLLADKKVEIVLNPDYDKGQSTSLQAGLRTLAADIDAVLFLLADQPLITPDIINQILTAYGESSDSPIVMPVFQGRRGNPVLFSRETFTRIEALSEDCGARPLFNLFADRLLAIPVDNPAIHFDIDTEEDYQNLLQMTFGENR